MAALHMTVRWSTAVLLIWAALAKAAGPASPDTLYGEWAGRLPGLGGAVSATEIGVGVLLLTGWRPRISAVVAIGLLGLFCGLIADDLARDRPKACGCLSGTAAESPHAIYVGLVLALVRNSVAIAGLTWLAVTTPVRPSTVDDPGLSGPALLANPSN